MFSRQRTLPALTFRPDVEGLRGIAILLVVASHAGVPGLAGGYIGVDVFFVLSGYLITWLLVHEAESTGRVDLVGFYARRCRRLFPALGVVLVATLAAAHVLMSPIDQLSLWKTALATALYSSNIVFASRSIDYHAAEGVDRDPLLHTWSLAVEEQFYLVWPLLILLACRSRRGLVVTLTLVSVVSFAACLLLTSTRQPWAFFLSPTRAWEFGIGGLAALYVGRTGVLAWAGAVGLVVAAIGFDDATQFPGAAAALPALATVALLLGSDRMRAMLACSPLLELGRVSYSWYLWHWPVLVIGSARLPDESSWLGGVGLSLLALGLAKVTYRIIENPIRRSTTLALRPHLAVSMGLMVAVAGCVSSLTFRYGAQLQASDERQALIVRASYDEPALPAGCRTTFRDIRVSVCTVANRDAPRTMLVFGDSHAAQWIPALHGIADELGMRLVLLSKAACPIPDVPPFFYETLGRKYIECPAWRDAALEKIEELRPEIAILTSSFYYEITPDEWRDGLHRTLKALRHVKHVVYLRDMPRPGFDVPSCLAYGSAPCDFPRSSERREAIWLAEQSVLGKAPNARTIDLTNEWCPSDRCPPETESAIIYRDANHLTATFVESLRPALRLELYGLLGLGKGPAGGVNAPL